MKFDYDSPRITSEVKRMLIIAYSSGYEHGHHDTVEGIFSGNGLSEDHDTDANEWLNTAENDGSLDRGLTL